MASRESGRGGLRSAGAPAAAAGVAGLLLGLGLGALSFRGGGEPPGAGGDAPGNAALRADLDRERREREALEAEVALLRAALESPIGEGDAATEAPLRDGAVADPAADAGAETEAPAGGFDVAALEALGLDPGETARLRDRYERFELDRLYLQNTARREGWRGRARFRQARRALWDDLRADLSEREYDLTLYAAGRKNRVIVSDVLANSAAEDAGVRPGDVLYRYDGDRVFDAFSLVRATADGEAGALTEMRVRRGGDEVRLFLPRGPLGVRLSQERRPPDPRR